MDCGAQVTGVVPGGLADNRHEKFELIPGLLPSSRKQLIRCRVDIGITFGGEIEGMFQSSFYISGQEHRTEPDL
jgi:hypothetical protein